MEEEAGNGPKKLHRIGHWFEAIPTPFFACIKINRNGRGAVV